MKTLIKYLGFPLEKQHQKRVEKQCFEHIYKGQIVFEILVIICQILMIFFISVRQGGPFAKPRRIGYFWLYVILLGVTLFMLGIKFICRKRLIEKYKTFYILEQIYLGFVCIWSTAITLNDQLGGNGLNVFTYMSLTVSVLSIAELWKNILLFMGNFVLLNLLLPYFPVPSGADHSFNNFMNSLFVSLFAIMIAGVFYHYRIKEEYNKIIIQKQLQEICEVNTKLHKEVLTDKLTGVYNRRYLEDVLSVLFQKNYEMQEDMACIMIDIDYFKKYNDTYGHQAGDKCLIAVSKFLQEKIQQENGHIIRYGGEEFLLLLFGEKIKKVIDKIEEIRKSIENGEFISDIKLEGTVTISAGIYQETLRKEQCLENCIRFADQALYKAKGNGRNRIIIYKKKTKKSDLKT